MNHRKIVCAIALAFLAAATAQAGDKRVDCDKPGQTISERLQALEPGDTLTVQGTCREFVVLPQELRRIHLDGGGTASIHPPGPTGSAVQIRGQGITLTGFTITGGFNGVLVRNGASALLAGNTIHGNERDGLVVIENASASVTHNAIRDNGRYGVLVSESANIRLGILNLAAGELAAGGVGPNTIEGNGSDGVQVLRGSSAVLVENRVAGNGRNGVSVLQNAHALLAGNTLDANAQDGILVGDGSGVNLGTGGTTNSEDQLNHTASANGGFGIRCFVYSYARGGRGTLAGAAGAKSFTPICYDGVVP